MADGVRESEYEFLRGELDTNKRFIFERPLLIVGTGLALAAAFGDASAFELASIPLLALLIFNLGFVAGTWWATRLARQKSHDASLPPAGHPGQSVTPLAPAYTIDPVGSRN